MNMKPQENIVAFTPGKIIFFATGIEIESKSEAKFEFRSNWIPSWKKHY